MKSIRKFFNLCSEEFYLAEGEKKSRIPGLKSRKNRKIDENVWELWKDGMSYHMKNKTFSAGWELVKEEGYGEKFNNFMRDEIMPRGKTSPLLSK